MFISKPSSCILRLQRGQPAINRLGVGKISRVSAFASLRDQAIEEPHSLYDRRQALLSLGAVAGCMTFMDSPAQAGTEGEGENAPLISAKSAYLQTQFPSSVRLVHMDERIHHDS